MAEHKKEELAPLEKVLGVSLRENAEIVATTGGVRKELRIKSLGGAVYDIWAASFDHVESRPNNEIEALEKKLGVTLTEGASVEVSTSEGANRVLRIKSIGAAAYDIWTGTVETKR